MTNEPKLRVIFSEQGRKKALAMTAEEKQALNYFTDLYVKTFGELWVLNDFEKQPTPKETPN